MISTDGTVHNREFVGPNHVDWLSIEAEPSITYLIEASVLPGSEMADLSVEIYNDCNNLTLRDSQDITLTRDIHLAYTPLQTETLYLKIADVVTDSLGTRPYNLSIYAMDSQPQPGAVIVMASQLKDNEEQQAKINKLARRFYDFYADIYPEERKKLFITEVEQSQHRSDSQEPPTKEDLRKAITEWAAPLVGKHQPFTLYLVGHSDQDSFYIDESNGERLEPDELDGWLDELEVAAPEADINIIIEASHSGSFIRGEKSISKPARMIITSANDKGQAYSTEDGAIFSDFFMDALEDGTTVFHSYTTGHWAANVTRYWQVPGIDANGDRKPNSDEDYAIASRRGLLFNLPGATSVIIDSFPPFIVNLSAELKGGICLIEAEVRDDGNDLIRVWSVTYEPGFEMPIESAGLAVDTTIGVTTTTLTTITTMISMTITNPNLVEETSIETGTADDVDEESPGGPNDGSREDDLTDQGGDLYTARYSCTKNGTYRIVVHAEDGSGNQAMPVRAQVTDQMIFLPHVEQ